RQCHFEVRSGISICFIHRREKTERSQQALYVPPYAAELAALKPDVVVATAPRCGDALGHSCCSVKTVAELSELDAQAGMIRLLQFRVWRCAAPAPYMSMESPPAPASPRSTASPIPRSRNPTIPPGVLAIPTMWSNRGKLYRSSISPCT